MASAIQIDELLKRVSEDAPCGLLDSVSQAQLDALDSAIDRLAKTGLGRLRRFGEGLFRGGNIPDMSDFEGKKTVEVKPLKHLKPATLLSIALLESDGLLGFADGLVLTERLLSDQWDNVHPLGDPNNPEPFLKRVLALNPLEIADPAKPDPNGPTIDPLQVHSRLLKASLFVSDRHGALSVRDALSPWKDRFEVTLPAGEDRTADFVYEVRLGATQTLPDIQHALNRATKALQSIEQRFGNVKGSYKPKLGYLQRLLNSALSVAEDRLDAKRVIPNPTTGTTPGGNSGTPVFNGSPEELVRKLREEAIRKLTEAEECFRKIEPGSPIPLMIARVKSLAGRSFLELLKELQLGDQAVQEFTKLAGPNGQVQATTATTQPTNN
jgi:type VI secretion system protein ImpA